MSSSANKEAKSTAKDASVAEKSKKRKRQSPFRIRVGCVVALRYRPATGNHVTLVVPPADSSGSSKPIKHALHSLVGLESHVEVWTDPVPGRDEGLALIGRRVRCFFARPVHASKQQGSVKTNSYIVEGEVVSVVNYGSQNWLHVQQRERRKRTSKAGLTVELLIDRDLLTKAPFLKRTDEDVDISKLKKDSAKKTLRNEEAIRGKNKVTVKVTLADPSALVPHKNTDDKSNLENTRDIAKWAIRKRIPNKPGEPLEEPEKRKKRKHNGSAEITSTKEPDGKSDNSKSNLTESKDTNKSKGTETSIPNGKPASGDKLKDPTSASSNTDKNKNGKPDASGDSEAPSKKKRKLNGSKKSTNAPTQYMGDGNDDVTLQQRNWRWFCARYYDMYLSSSTVTQSTTIHNDTFRAYEYYSELLASCGGFIGEVLEVTPSSKSNTLAMVTLRRLILPEHTACGRLALHNHGNGGVLEVFDDYDSALFDLGKKSPEGMGADCEANGGFSSVVFRVPIEELVIVSRRVQRHAKPLHLSSASEDITDSCVEELHILSSYSLKDDVRVPLALMASENGKVTSGLAHSSLCHRCRRVLPDADIRRCSSEQCALLQSMAHDEDDPKEQKETIGWCKSCLRQVNSSVAVVGNDSELAPSTFPCCIGHCDCRRCRTSMQLDEAQTSICNAILDASSANDAAAANSNEQSAVDEDTDPFSESITLVKSMSNCEFDIPRDLITLQDLPLSSGKPITKVKAPGKRGRKQSAVASGKKSPGPAERKKADSASRSGSSKKAKSKDEKSATNGRTLQRKVSEDYSVFKPTCSRLMDYTEIAASKARCLSPENEDRLSGDKPRNLRELEKKNCSLLTAEKDEKTTSSRRMRASQRRLMKDFSAIGATSLSLDILAGREQQLRFDRSSIHAWGVFADAEIMAEDMIVEYRGELIGNAMAEKREREYELAKIGSDYMFRIDNLVVCDATKQGNVARFINASCDPNCYTKIITSDGKQRIAIYAKKDIKVAEELCYDYKFPLEYDESKRIPCHCGASECRGFMNWDKRYVVMPGTGRDTNTAQEAIKQPSEREVITNPT